MIVNVNFIGPKGSKEMTMPLSQQELYDAIIYVGADLNHDWSTKLRSPNLQIAYNFATDSSGWFRTFARIGDNFIDINIAMMMWNRLSDYDKDVVRVYCEHDAPGCALEFANIIAQANDIDCYGYEYDNPGDSEQEKYAKTRFASEIPGDFHDYIDWHSMGQDYSDYAILGEYCYIDADSIYSLDLEYYDFEEICEDIDWDISKEFISKYNNFNNNINAEKVLTFIA